MAVEISNRFCHALSAEQSSVQSGTACHIDVKTAATDQASGVVTFGDAGVILTTTIAAC